MKTQLLKITLLLLVFIGFNTYLSAQTFTFSTGVEGWSTGFGANDPVTGPVLHAPTEGVSGDGALQLERTSGNANIGLNPGTINGGTMNYIKIVYKNQTPAFSFRIQGSSTAGTLPQVVFPIESDMTEYATTYLDMTGVTNWSGTIDNLDILVRGNASTLPPDDAGEYVFFDEITFLSFTAGDTFSGHVQNPGFDDVLGGYGVWNPSDKGISTVTVTDEETPVDGFQSLKIAFTADQPAAGVDGNVAIFSNSFVPVGPYTAPNVTELRAKMWVKYKSNPAAPLASKDITIQGNWKLENTGGANIGALSGNTTQTCLEGEWTEFNFSQSYDGDFNQAQFRPIVVFGNGMLQYETLYFDAIESCDDCLTLGVENIIKDDASVRLYPNPANSVLNIQADGRNISKIEVYSVLGRRVLSAKNTKSINVSTLSRGVYITKLYGDDSSVSTKRFVKE